MAALKHAHRRENETRSFSRSCRVPSIALLPLLLLSFTSLTLAQTPPDAGAVQRETTRTLRPLALPQRRPGFKTGGCLRYRCPQYAHSSFSSGARFSSRSSFRRRIAKRAQPLVFGGFADSMRQTRQILILAPRLAALQKRSCSPRYRHCPVGSPPSFTFPIRMRLRPVTLRPTSSHMRRIWRFLPSRSTNLS